MNRTRRSENSLKDANKQRRSVSRPERPINMRFPLRYPPLSCPPPPLNRRPRAIIAKHFSSARSSPGVVVIIIIMNSTHRRAPCRLPAPAVWW